MLTFDDTLRLVDLELFDAAFAVAPSDEEDVRRRFMTLFASESARHRGGSADVCRATNIAGEEFALKELHIMSSEAGESAQQHEAGTPPRPHKELRHSVGSSGATPSGTPDYVTRGHVAAFYEEYRIHLAVAHLRGFPELYGFGLAAGSPVMVMEWVEGITLREALATYRATHDEPLPLATIARLGIAVLSILQRAGELSQHFVHRDLSPRNIMLRTSRTTAESQLESGEFDLCLIDFGSSSLTAGPLDATFTMSENVWRMGTPAYAPPEMLTSDVAFPEQWRQSPAIDVYALCSILYELYGGMPPFGRSFDSSRSPYRVKTESTPAPLTLRGPDGGALAGAIEAGLACSPDVRPSLRELHAALTNWLEIPAQPRPRGNGPTTTSPLWQEDGARRTLTRRRLITGAILGTSVLLSGALVAKRFFGTNGTVLDENRYSRAEGPYEGEPLFRAFDKTLRCWGLYAASGTLACSFASSRPCGALREGLVALYDDLSQQWGYVVPYGSQDQYAWAILPRFAQAKRFSEGLAPAQDPTSKLWGYLDQTGAWAIAAQFGEAEPFSGGVAAVRQPDGPQLWGAIDPAGDWAFQPTYAALGSRSADGLAAAQEETGAWGVVDDTGQWTCAPRFAQLRQVACGLAPARVATEDLWGFVDATGTWVLEPRFADARPYCQPTSWSTPSTQEPRAAVQDAATLLWHFIDESGTLAHNTKPRFAKLGDLFDGLAPAQASLEDDVVVFDESEPDVRAEDAGYRYGYVDATGSWQMRRLTELTNTAIEPAAI